MLNQPWNILTSCTNSKRCASINVIMDEGASDTVKHTARGKGGDSSTAKQPRKRIKGLLKKLQEQASCGVESLPR